jgi:hypothetical protein
MSWYSTNYIPTIFALTLASPDFGIPMFWLAMILVGQTLDPNQPDPIS